MDAQNPVNPIVGEPAAAQPGPAPIPRRMTRFRAAAPMAGNVPIRIEAFPVSTGIAPLLAYADGYQAVEVPYSGLNQALPSYLNCSARVYLTNQRLSSNDKFLKEVVAYHPRLFDLYTSFIFIYHTLRVNGSLGRLSSDESTLLADLEREYNPANLPVPGTIVDVLQSITATENPYSWLGNIGPQVPRYSPTPAPNAGSTLDDHRHLVYPCPLMLIAQIFGIANLGRPTEAQYLTIGETIYDYGRTAITTDSPERTWLSTPHGRVGHMHNLRVVQLFADHVHATAGAYPVNGTILDLPNLPASNSGAVGNMAQYLGVIDHAGINNRQARFRRWPLQAASMVATACKYISGSRHLNDIAISGLGSFSHLSVLDHATILETRDVRLVQGVNSGAAVAVNTASRAAYFLESLTASLEVRDPVATDLSIQYAMLAQTNTIIESVIDRTGTAHQLVTPTWRSGPFWEYHVCERGPSAAVVNTLISHLPNFVRSNPRRDANE
ncbi:coat protein [Tulasnella partitivirus 3]|nr:coat protein [Tulasnella partitivirus 3]